MTATEAIRKKFGDRKVWAWAVLPSDDPATILCVVEWSHTPDHSVEYRVGAIYLDMQERITTGQGHYVTTLIDAYRIYHTLLANEISLMATLAEVV